MSKAMMLVSYCAPDGTCGELFAYTSFQSSKISMRNMPFFMYDLSSDHKWVTLTWIYIGGLEGSAPIILIILLTKMPSYHIKLEMNVETTYVTEYAPYLASTHSLWSGELIFYHI